MFRWKLSFDIDIHPSDNLVFAAFINGDFLLYPPSPPPSPLFLFFSIFFLIYIYVIEPLMAVEMDKLMKTPK